MCAIRTSLAQGRESPGEGANRGKIGLDGRQIPPASPSFPSGSRFFGRKTPCRRLELPGIAGVAGGSQYVRQNVPRPKAEQYLR